MLTVEPECANLTTAAAETTTTDGTPTDAETTLPSCNLLVVLFDYY